MPTPSWRVEDKKKEREGEKIRGEVWEKEITGDAHTTKDLPPATVTALLCLLRLKVHTAFTAHCMRDRAINERSHKFLEIIPEEGACLRFRLA